MFDNQKRVTNGKKWLKKLVKVHTFSQHYTTPIIYFFSGIEFTTDLYDTDQK